MKLDMVLFIVFLILKLVGVIDWSWWWVTAPIWLPAVIVVVLSVIKSLISRE